MSVEAEGRRRRLATMTVFLLLLAVFAAILTAIPLRDRAMARKLAAPYTPLHEPQETPMDFLQEPPYAGALVLCLVMVVRLRRRPDRLPYWMLLGLTTAWLLWREMPWDERVLGANTFSWAKYLSHSDVPLWARIVFGGGSIAATVATVAYVVRTGRALGRLIRERLFALSMGLIVAAGLALAGAQLLDKHRETDRFLRTHLTMWDLKDYLEESLEFFGPMLLLMACVMAVLEEPRSPPDSQGG